MIIKAGAKLYFGARTALRVEEGQLEITGTKANPVILKSAKKGKWSGIDLIASPLENLIDFAQISESEDTGIDIIGSRAVVLNTQIFQCAAEKGAGIYFERSLGYMEKCLCTLLTNGLCTVYAGH